MADGKQHCLLDRLLHTHHLNAAMEEKEIKFIPVSKEKEVVAKITPEAWDLIL